MISKEWKILNRDSDFPNPDFLCLILNKSAGSFQEADKQVLSVYS